jgi:hypothetical protein
MSKNLRPDVVVVVIEGVLEAELFVDLSLLIRGGMTGVKSRFGVCMSRAGVGAGMGPADASGVVASLDGAD